MFSLHHEVILFYNKTMRYFKLINGRPVKILESENINTSINKCYVELNNKQNDFYDSHPMASVYEVFICTLFNDIDIIEKAKNDKINEIISYDMSDEINGFYFDGNFMWLDRDTRACLKNTIESLELMNMHELNIWYGGIYVTLDTDMAKMLLSQLEIYAMQCYNITESHKVEISNMDNISDIYSFDITKDYPKKLEFTSTN